jgi:hypothetical protein
LTLQSHLPRCIISKDACNCEFRVSEGEDLLKADEKAEFIEICLFADVGPV